MTLTARPEELELVPEAALVAGGVAVTDAEAAAANVKAPGEKDQAEPLPTAMLPVAPSAGTVTFTSVLLTFVTPASCAVPTHADLIPDRPVPVTVMTVPGGPEAGLKPVM